jgi:hypothetical protein
MAAHDPGGVLDGLAPPELELGRPHDLGMPPRRVTADAKDSRVRVEGLTT